MRLSFRTLAFFALLSNTAIADFDDYVDPTFECPATTACKQVCVVTALDCPTEMLCDPLKNETLCPDGTCSDSCEGHEESPCAYNCAPVACNKVVDAHDNCRELYGYLWDAEAYCGENELADEANLFTYTEPVFIFFYSWFGAIPLLLLFWCAFNQRLAPVPGSCKALDLDSDTSDKKENARVAWQTGYKYHPIGATMNVMTTLTILAIYTLMSWLVIQYYIQQEAITWSWVTGRFDDEAQVLLCFILVWMYGFMFVFSLKFPHSIRSLHLRRCDLAEADFVAVAVKRLEIFDTEVTFSHDHMRGLKTFFSAFSGVVHSIMTFLFSVKHTFGCERKGDATFAFRPVQRDWDGTKFVTFEFRRYNLKKELSHGEEKGSKYVPGAWVLGSSIQDILNWDTPAGLSAEDIEARRRVVGSNKVEMERPSFLRALKREFSTPFYTYQFFMVFSWLPLWYYYMAFTWTFVILVGAITVSVLKYKNERNLYRLTHVDGETEVVRAGGKIVVSQDKLVPGDIVTVQPGLSYCDMILVDSTRVLVDESALTGEANPVGKIALDPLMAKQKYVEEAHKRNTILAGTTVLETDNSRAIVLKTASYTARGELIRDIFSFRRNTFKFDSEIPVVVTLLFFYACFGWGMAYHWTGEIFVFGWFYGIYVVAGCLPPLLPTVFTVSVGISDDRLAKKKIACSNSESILVAGKVTRAFFDKTGTITKQGLDFVSARGKSSWIDVSKGFSKEMSLSFSTDELKLGMACCHNLTRNNAGEMIGNPVDRVVFSHSRATVDGVSQGHFLLTDDTGRQVAVLKQFDFDHHRMTQSVVVQSVSDGQLIVFCKGSGEAIRAISKKATMPSNFDAVLRQSARSGLYQISMASKTLGIDTDVSNLSRDQVESDLSFQGVINFKNTMRENAPEVIRQLRDGEVKSTMITGDSVLTGICIAKEAGLLQDSKAILAGSLEADQVVWRTEDEDRAVTLPSIDALQNVQLAISGAAWQHIRVTDPKLAVALQDSIRVFGRCTPHDKVAVVQGFSKAGHITLMSGDGGNDCGALKAAHVGVALSDAEASIVAPFTSLEKDIGDVLEVIREGRCALGSALASYKFVILYGQILTINQLIAAYFNITFAEWGWVFMDGVWTIILSFSLPLARAAKKLAPTRPTASILGAQTMNSALGVLVLNFIFVVIAFVALNNQDWYQCRKWEGTDVSNLFVIGDNYETEVLWLVTGFQVISSAAVFNFGYEFRQAWIRNWVLLLFLAGFTTIHFYITLVPSELSCFFRINCVNENTVEGIYGALSIQNDFNTTVMPESFRRILVIIMSGNLTSVVAWDYLVVNGTRRHVAFKRRAAAAQAQNQDGLESPYAKDLASHKFEHNLRNTAIAEEVGSSDEEEVDVETSSSDDSFEPPPMTQRISNRQTSDGIPPLTSLRRGD